MYSVAVSHTFIIGPTYILTHVERGQGKKQHLLYLFEILTLPNMTLPVGFHSCWPLGTGLPGEVFASQWEGFVPTHITINVVTLSYKVD